jgi:hypothetical protein
LLIPFSRLDTVKKATVEQESEEKLLFIQARDNSLHCFLKKVEQSTLNTQVLGSQQLVEHSSKGWVNDEGNRHISVAICGGEILYCTESLL